MHICFLVYILLYFCFFLHVFFFLYVHYQHTWILYMFLFSKCFSFLYSLCAVDFFFCFYMCFTTHRLSYYQVIPVYLLRNAEQLLNTAAQSGLPVPLQKSSGRAFVSFTALCTIENMISKLDHAIAYIYRYRYVMQRCTSFYFQFFSLVFFFFFTPPKK